MKNAFKEKGGAKTSDNPDEAQVAVFVTMPPVRRLHDKEKASPRSPIDSGSVWLIFVLPNNEDKYSNGDYKKNNGG